MDLGADQFIDYKTERFEEVIQDIDLILDYVLIGGTENTTDRSWGVLKPGGTIVSVADPTITSKVPKGYHGFFPFIETIPDQLEVIAEQLANGKIKSKVARVFSRKQLVEAMEINKAGGTTGRLIVDFKWVINT